MNLPEWGEVWWTDHPNFGRRPVVVITRNQTIASLRWAMIAPCTTTIRGLDTEVVLEPGDDPVAQRSAANLDSVESVPVAMMIERLGALSSTRMDQICAALTVATGCG